MANVYVVNDILFGDLSDRPDAARSIIIWVDSATRDMTISNGTSWEDLAGGGGGSALSLVTVTADYTVLTTDHTILVAASGKTITLPDPSTVPADTEFRIGNTAAGDTTTVATAAGTILGAATYTGLAGAGAAAHFVNDGVSDYSIF